MYLSRNPQRVVAKSPEALLVNLCSRIFFEHVALVQNPRGLAWTLGIGLKYPSLCEY